MSLLRDTVDASEAESLAAEQKEEDEERSVECLLAQGRAEGEARLLRRLGITSAAAYRNRFGEGPSDALA